MEIKIARRKHAKIKMALQGNSGSGKTYSALQIAYGLSSNWGKIVVIDTENGSANLYAHLGEYRVLCLSGPFTPEKYVDAIAICEKAQMEVIIIDSITHEWENLLEYHGNLPGNSFTNWNKVTPRHNLFVNKLLQSPCHIMATVRTKQDYVLNEKNGKMVPEKVGLKSVQRDGIDYEFTLVFDLDSKHLASASKDRTGLFSGKPEFLITPETGERISKWCLEQPGVSEKSVADRINACKSLNELLEIYKEFPEYKQSLLPEFEQRKRQLLLHNGQITLNKTSSNGSI